MEYICKGEILNWKQALLVGALCIIGNFLLVYSITLDGYSFVAATETVLLAWSIVGILIAVMICSIKIYERLES